MDISIFPDKEHKPAYEDLPNVLGDSFELWKEIEDFVFEQYPNAVKEWNYPGKKYGWSYRLKDKKRAILYFLPRDKYFKVAFVYGQKATDEILKSEINENIKQELSNAKVYAEGRGVGFVANNELISDIKKLVEIKLAY